MQVTFDDIRAANNAKNWQQSIDLCQQFLQQDDSKWEIYWWLGHDYKNLKQYDEAEQWFKQLQERFPNMHQGLEGWVNIAEHQQNWQEMEYRAKVFQEKYPDLWHVAFWFGVTAKQLGRLAEAEQHFTVLTQKRPTWHRGLEELIKLAQQVANQAKVIELANQFIQQFPQMALGYWAKGLAQKNLAQYDLAEQTFAQMRENLPNHHQGWEGKITIAQAQNQWQRVLDLAIELVDKFPNSWVGYWFVGQAHKNLAQYDLAEKIFAQLRKDFPNHHCGWEGTVNIVQYQANWQEVIRASENFRQQFPHMWQSYGWVGHAYKNLGEYDLALEQFQELQSRFPNQHHGFEGEINVAQVQNQWKRVLDLATAFVDKFPNMWQGYWFIGQAHKNLAQYDLAEKIFAQLRKDFPNHHCGWEGDVNIAQHQANWQEVIRASQDFRQHFPHMWQSYWWTGHAYKNLGEYDLALEQFQELQSRFPNLHYGFEGSVLVAQQQQNWQQVVTSGQQLIQRFPHMWQGYWFIGQAHKNLGQYERTKAVFAQLRERLPHNHRGWEGVVNIAQHQQDYQATIQAAQQFQQQFPHMWQGWWWEGHAYKNSFQYEAAEHAFQTLIEKFTHMHQGYEGMVNVAEHQQDWATVLQRALIFRQHFPHLWHSYYWEGRVYREQAQYEQAECVYREMMTKFPNNIRGINGLIDIANNQADWQQALNWCEQAIELFPYHLPFYERKGWALLHLKYFDEAETYYTQLAQQISHDPMPILGLASVYAITRQKEKEKVQLLRALLLFPDRENIAQRLVQHLAHHGDIDTAEAVYSKYIRNPNNNTNLTILHQFSHIHFGNKGNRDYHEKLYREHPDNILFVRRYANSLISYI